MHRERKHSRTLPVGVGESLHVFDFVIWRQMRNDDVGSEKFGCPKTMSVSALSRRVTMNVADR